MLRHTIDSLLGSVLLATIASIVLFSTMHTRMGFSRPRAKTKRPDSPSRPAPSRTTITGEFQFHRAVEAYEHLIDSVIAEERA